jgi:hypothetical protein
MLVLAHQSSKWDADYYDYDDDLADSSLCSYAVGTNIFLWCDSLKRRYVASSGPGPPQNRGFTTNTHTHTTRQQSSKPVFPNRRAAARYPGPGINYTGPREVNILQWKYSEENNIRECVEKLRPRTSK